MLVLFFGLLLWHLSICTIANYFDDFFLTENHKFLEYIVKQTQYLQCQVVWVFRIIVFVQIDAAEKVDSLADSVQSRHYYLLYY